jgi:DNA polymerase III alpha subunit
LTIVRRRNATNRPTRSRPPSNIPDTARPHVAIHDQRLCSAVLIRWWLITKHAKIRCVEVECVEQQYTSLADLLRSAEGDPAGLASLEGDLASGAIRLLPTAEWSPETIAAYERAHLGFLTASPIEVQRHAERLVEEFGVTNVAELVDLPDKAPVSVGAIVTNLRLRTTRKGDRMAWLTLADATGAIEAAVFPQAFERLVDSADRESPLREGAFLVARGRLSQEEATGCKLFVDEVTILGGKASHMSALMVAIEEQQPDEWSSAMGA